jgi:hypothetical protein
MSTSILFKKTFGAHGSLFLVLLIHPAFELKKFLLKCVLGTRIHSIHPVNQSLSDVFASFAKAGILKIDAQRYYIFSLLLANTHRYFPYRTDSDPSTLRELVMKAIQSMSATSLISSTSSPDDFPKETTFQHLFTLGLFHNTTFNTAICSDACGASSWLDVWTRLVGISAVSVCRVKYAGLQSKAYVVLDFCKGIKNACLDPHRATASSPFPLVARPTFFLSM